MSTPASPHLADLVLSGETQVAAEAITDFIFMAKDISNAYLVTTADGDVLINTGFLTTGPRNQSVFAPHRTGPLRAIILTQSHPDHFGGINSFQEEETKIIVQEDFLRNMHDMAFLQGHFGPRTRKLWGTTVKFDTLPPKPPVVVPDILVDRSYSFTQGGRAFEVISTPDGEATDGLSVWLPAEKILFTGNLFGPVFLSMPFLCTLRGDKPRLVRSYLKSLDRVRQLGAELLITGHGAPIHGAACIRADLDKMRAAVTWVCDYTLAGMNAGHDVHQLMREVELPPDLQIGEFHGKLSWAVRSIWEEYSGWFHYDSTTSLYGVPRSSIDADLVELAGGATPLALRARQKLDAGEPLAALHLLDVALGAEPCSQPALVVKRDALAQLLQASGGSNLSETMWLRSEIAAVEQQLPS